MGAGHSHDHAPADYSRAFALGIILNLGIVILETVFGLLSGSMALLADAGHNLSDVLGLVVAWAGAAMARKRASRRFTYGLKKGSILAALTNALMLMVTGWISTRWDLGFAVSGFWAAFFGGLVVGLVSLLLTLGLPGKNGERTGG